MKHRFVLAVTLLLWSAAAGWSAPVPTSTTVSLELQQTPLHRALELLFSQSGFQYIISHDFPDLPISMRVHEIPFSEALQTLLRLGTPGVPLGGSVVPYELTYRKEGDIYMIGARENAQPVVGFGGPGMTAAPAPAVEKIPVNFIRSSEAIAYLNQQPVQGIVSIQPLPRDNGLVVRGDPDAIQGLKNLLRIADVPALPLSVSAGISGPGLNGVPLAIRSSARAVIGDNVTIDEQAAAGGPPAQMKVRLQTQLLGTGDLQVASDWEVSVPIAGGPKGPIRLVKRLSTTTLIHTGEKVSVAEVDLAGWGGKGVLRLWIRGEWGRRDAAMRNAR